MLTELFADQPQTGGTDVPASGATETLTLASGGGFPAVSAASGSQFHVADPAAPSELIAVTQTGPAWTVTRGAEGTTPVAHQGGWTARQVVTAGVLGSMVQAVDARAFGATSDGTTDDTAALTAWIGAVNQASGTFAVLPPDRYMISGPLPASQPEGDPWSSHPRRRLPQPLPEASTRTRCICRRSFVTLPR